jgi:signal transduction histidine kinase
MTRPSAGPSLRVRIFGAMALVVLAGAGTLMVVSLVVAPSVFFRHLEEAGIAQDPGVTTHVTEGFALATLASTVIGVIIAGAVAAGMAVLVARRIATPISTTAQAASRLASGDYAAHVDDPRMGPELAELTASVNALADRLEDTEQARIELMADLAHQLRTPIASINATVEAIADGVIPADANSLTTLTDNAVRLTRLVDDLALVSRAEERAFVLHVQTVDLVTVAQAAKERARSRFEAKGVPLALSTDHGGSVLVRVDPDRMGEVIDQLLDNALQHTTPAGAVTMRVGTNPDAALLIVTDTGDGFHPDESELIFERFRRASNAPEEPGRGVGLAIARALVDAQGGTLTGLSGGVGSGASFTVKVPRAVE